MTLLATQQARERNRQKTLKVLVLEGSLRLSNRRFGDSLLLTPGHLLSPTRGRLGRGLRGAAGASGQRGQQHRHGRQRRAVTKPAIAGHDASSYVMG